MREGGSRDNKKESRAVAARRFKKRGFPDTGDVL